MLLHHDPIGLHVYTDFGRFYQVNEQHYPGVGTILNATDSFEQQEFWRKWRSNPENIEYSDLAKDRGKLFHGMAENYFRSGDYRIDSQDEDTAIAEHFWQSVQDILPRITAPLLIESAVWHQVGCYGGTVDLVASFDGQPVILDWKTSAKPKKAEWLDRYPLQLTAYCGAINRMYGTRIKNGVIVVALPDRKAQVFQFALREYWGPWLRRLVNYWQEQSTPLAAEALGMIHEEYPGCYLLPIANHHPCG